MSIGPSCRPRQTGGFALVSAVFLLVVLASIGAVLVTISGVQHMSTAQATQADRAYFAARAGLEWAIWKAVAPAGGGCPAGPSNFTLTDPGLSGFQVSVSCVRTDHPQGFGVVPYYVVNVTAQAGQYGGIDFVSRNLQAKVIGL